MKIGRVMSNSSILIELMFRSDGDPIGKEEFENSHEICTWGNQPIYLRAAFMTTYKTTNDVHTTYIVRNKWST